MIRFMLHFVSVLGMSDNIGSPMLLLDINSKISKISVSVFMTNACSVGLSLFRVCMNVEWDVFRHVVDVV